MGNLVDFAAKNNVVQLKGFKETLRALTSPAALKHLIILFTYFGIYQFSGVNPVTFYAVQVFQVCILFAQMNSCIEHYNFFAFGTFPL
jgi:hypothetical protein